MPTFKEHFSLTSMTLAVCAAVFLASCAGEKSKPNQTELKAAEIAAEGNRDVINRIGVPDAPDVMSISVLFDRGAWHGYGLGAQDANGFAGPYLITRNNGFWAAQSLGAITLKNGEEEINLSVTEKFSAPGRLVSIANTTDGALETKTTLFFSAGRTALVRTNITNNGEAAATLNAAWGFSPLMGGGAIAASQNGVTISYEDSPTFIETSTPGGATTLATSDDASYSLRYNDDLELAPGASTVLYLAQSAYFDAADKEAVSASQQDGLTNPETAYKANVDRWHGYLASIDERASDAMNTAKRRRLAIKGVETLIGNWRSPAGDLLHNGVIPSYAVRYFHGFWAWDSWKHAVAITQFDPALAKDQMRAMFDYQDERGMVADVIYRRKEGNNWRDTKPPLAAWAVHEIYEATGDVEFVTEMAPKLIKYHQWWYQDRDHDGDGLAEFGSTDGTRIAAAWESGMDNAVRFDDAVMVQNNDAAWSLNQESVDLNAYLYAEKLYLAALLDVLGDTAQAATLRLEAEPLKEKVRTQMFNEATGYFHDINMETGAPIEVYGPEGWTPLWTRLATEEQAASVVAAMVNPEKFATHMPFPTLAADDPKFDPHDGYWRGPVWLDQAYFGVKALEYYGYTEEANDLRARLMDNAEGLNEGAPIYENYHPHTGAVLEAPHFSWAAAHYLLMLLDHDDAPAGTDD